MNAKKVLTVFGLLIPLAGLAATAGATHNAGHINETEANNDCATANQMNPVMAASISGSVGLADQLDHFKIWAYKSEKIGWAVSSNPGNDIWGGLATTCPPAATGPSGTFSVAASGTILGQTQYRITSLQNPATYTNFVTVSPNDFGLNSDVGNSFAARTTTGGGASSGALPAADGSRNTGSAASDEDWYGVQMPTGGAIRVTMTPERSDFDLKMLDHLGNTRKVSQNGGTNTESITCFGDVPGVWGIGVYPFGNAVGGGYSLTITVDTIGVPVPCF